MQREPDVATQLQSDFDKRILREITQARLDGYNVGFAQATSSSFLHLAIVLGAMVLYLMWSNRQWIKQA